MPQFSYQESDPALKYLYWVNSKNHVCVLWYETIFKIYIPDIVKYRSLEYYLTYVPRSISTLTKVPHGLQDATHFSNN